MFTTKAQVLRSLVFIAAAIGTCFWIGVCIQALTIPSERRDGFHMLGVMMTTAYFLILVLPALIVAILNRWLWLGLALAIPIVAIATDTVLPWLPWNWLG